MSVETDKIIAQNTIDFMARMESYAKSHHIIYKEMNPETAKRILKIKIEHDKHREEKRLQKYNNIMEDKKRRLRLAAEKVMYGKPKKWRKRHG